MTVYASWNGANDIARWRILAGATRQTLKPLTEKPWAGFETTATVFTHASDVAIQAMEPSGSVLGTSSAVKPGARAG
jgi:hypothetical protein